MVERPVMSEERRLTILREELERNGCTMMAAFVAEPECGPFISSCLSALRRVVEECGSHAETDLELAGKGGMK